MNAAPRWVFKPSPKSSATQLTPFQTWLATARSRYLVGAAARRSGKTVGVRARLLIKALSTPNGLVGYVGPTLKQAKRLIWTALIRDLRDPSARQFLARRPNHSELAIEFRNGCRLQVYGAERPEGIRGEGFDLLCVDEADDPNYTEALFDEIIHPALSDQIGTLIQIGSPKGRGRLYREYRKGQDSSPAGERDPDYESRQVTAIEAGLLDPKEIERARRARPPRAFRQEYEASFEAPIGIIYEEWSPSVHVVSDAGLPRSFDEIIASKDWGTSNRGTMLIQGIDRVIIPPRDEYDAPIELARATVLEEVSESGVGYDDDGWWKIARRLQKKWSPSTWYADPAGGLEGYIRQLQQALRGARGNPRVVAADNEIRPGISAVQQLMHHDPVLDEPPRLLVHESCKWTCKEMEVYRWKPVRGTDNEYTDEPLKTSEIQALDALRYGAYSHLWQPHGRGRNRAGLDERI
jgi:hypothetical protein